MSLFNKSKSTQETTNVSQTETNLTDQRKSLTDDAVLFESGSSGNIDRSQNSAVFVENVSDEIAIKAIGDSSRVAESFLDNSLNFISQSLSDTRMGAKGEAERANALATKFFDETARLNKQQAFGLEGEILSQGKTIAVVAIVAIGLFFIVRKRK